MKSYYKKAAQILTKVFNASRLYAEVTPDMVELLASERQKEKDRSDVIMTKVKELLSSAGFECAKEIADNSDKKEVIVVGRIKTLLSSMYNLLAPKNGHHQNLNDMIGIMILCEDRKTCYDIADLINKKVEKNGCKIISQKDMIATPKKNGYQSIHFHIEDVNDILFEIQVKSYKMFAFSQTGDCKHELYKKRLETSMLKEDEWIIFDSLREEHWF